MERLLNLQDQYKFPMGQFIYEQEPAAEVTFKMVNRRAKSGMRIADYVSVQELQEYYDSLRSLRYTPEELAIIERQEGKDYTPEFLGYLAAFRLPEIEVSIDPATNDLTAVTSGKWNDVSQAEIPILKAIPTLYYPRYLADHDISKREWFRGGDERGTEFINYITSSGAATAEFGTRRAASSEWQDHMVGRMVEECPGQFIGTSNPWLAAKYGVKEVGTNAHELGSVFGALEGSRGGNPLDGQVRLFREWMTRFPMMRAALIDTFTSDVALHDMDRTLYEQTELYRIDSGVEEKIGQKVIAMLERVGIDPTTRTLMFTNSLSGKRVAELQHLFGGQTRVAFGVGGGSTNNMPYTPGLNVVCKAVEVNGIGTVKLSDDDGKHMGNPADVDRYLTLCAQRLAEPAAWDMTSAL